jgi:hypothetical protein
MKKLNIILLALVAVFAFSATVVGSASAETTLLAEWLVNGKAITAGTAFEALTGETLTMGHLGLAKVKCSWFFDGLVEADGKDLIESVLNLAGELLGEKLVGLAVSCESIETCEKTADINIWPVNLPWATNLYLMENGEFLDLFSNGGKGNLGFTVECLVLGISIDEECTAETSVLMTNLATDVEGEFNLAELTTEKLEGTCKGEAQVGYQEGVGLTSLVNGEVLSVSSEGE